MGEHASARRVNRLGEESRTSSSVDKEDPLLAALGEREKSGVGVQMLMPVLFDVMDHC